MPNEVTIGAVALPGRSGAFTLTLRNGTVAAIRAAEQPVEPTWLALPGLVNLHAHADRAYSVQSFRPRSFADALAASAAARAAFTTEDVAARALRLFESSIGHGVTRIRTHTDVDDVVEQRDAGRAGGEKAGRRQARRRGRRVLDLEERSGAARGDGAAQGRHRARPESDRCEPECQRRPGARARRAARSRGGEQAAGRSPSRRASRAASHAGRAGGRCRHRARP